MPRFEATVKNFEDWESVLAEVEASDVEEAKEILAETFASDLNTSVGNIEVHSVRKLPEKDGQ